MKLPFNIDVSCTEKTQTSFKLKSQDVFTVLITRIPGYWKHVNSPLFPFKTSAFKKFLSVLISSVLEPASGSDNWTYQISDVAPGITNWGQDYKALTVLYWSLPRLLVQRYLLNWSSLVWVQTAQLSPPFLTCTASYILSRLPIISFISPQNLMPSLFLYCQ